MPTAGLVLNYNVAAENQMVGDDQLMEQFLHDLTTESTQQAAATSAPVPHPAPQCRFFRVTLV